MQQTRPDESSADRRQRQDRPLPVWRIGLAGGLVGILCCVGPTVLALLGVVSAGTAFVWATDLYDGYRWWFRLAGLAVVAVLVWVALRRRNQCSLDGARTTRRRLVAVLAIAVTTYLVLYAVTTWLGRLA
jgi:chromate transport protein ChrA